MLVLSRRVGERLVIGDDIVLTVIDVRSDGVRIGIDAPRHVRVNRAEVLEAVQKANAEAAAVGDDAVESLRALRPATAPALAADPATAAAPAPASEQPDAPSA